MQNHYAMQIGVDVPVSVTEQRVQALSTLSEILPSRLEVKGKRVRVIGSGHSFYVPDSTGDDWTLIFNVIINTCDYYRIPWRIQSRTPRPEEGYWSFQARVNGAWYKGEYLGEALAYAAADSGLHLHIKAWKEVRVW